VRRMAGIKKKDLEIKLEEIPDHPNPSPEKEQYSTPAYIASDILFSAYVKGDIIGKVVADLGCGTGIFALGAAYLGAKKVKAVDIDEEALDIAKKKAKEWSVSQSIDFERKDVSDFRSDVDTVLMNPPFGSQKKGADIPFLKKAFEFSKTTYSLHNEKTVDFLEKFINDRGHDLFWEKRYMFEIYNQFKFHTKEKKDFEVIVLGIKIKRE